MTALNNADKVRLGSKVVTAAYRGGYKVWPWTPVQLPGLAAWIDPAQDSFTDGQNITSYTSHDPSKRVFTAAAGKEPVYRANSIDGKPRIEFTADGMSTTGYNPGTTGLTYVMVNRRTTPVNYGMIWTWHTVANGYELRYVSTTWQVMGIGDTGNGGPSQTAGYVESPNTDYIHMLRVDTAARTFRLYINDTQQYSLTAAPAMPNVAADLRIGFRSDGFHTNALVAEALVLSGPISDANRAKLVAYLRSKHGALPPV